jgi:hypothetical protein
MLFLRSLWAAVIDSRRPDSFERPVLCLDENCVSRCIGLAENNIGINRTPNREGLVSAWPMTARVAPALRCGSRKSGECHSWLARPSVRSVKVASCILRSAAQKRLGSLVFARSVNDQQEAQMSLSFAKDIRPLFREGDIECMGPSGVKLDDPAWMCVAANAQSVYKEVAAARCRRTRRGRPIASHFSRNGWMKAAPGK